MGPRVIGLPGSGCQGRHSFRTIARRIRVSEKCERLHPSLGPCLTSAMLTALPLASTTMRRVRFAILHASSPARVRGARGDGQQGSQITGGGLPPRDGAAHLLVDREFHCIDQALSVLHLLNKCDVKCVKQRPSRAKPVTPPARPSQEA